MRTTIFYLTLFFILISGTKAYSQTEITKTTLDSFEVLKNLDGMVIGINPDASYEEKRYWRLFHMLYDLPFSEMKKLLKADNKLARAYGCAISFTIYYDSMTREVDSLLFNDTASIPILVEKGSMDIGLTVGQICKESYKSETESRVIRARKSIVVDSIQNFILKNSKYPESFVLEEVTKYIWGRSENEIHYEIRLNYEIKDNLGQLQKASHYFVLDENFQIIVIEINRSNIYGATTPRTKDWLAQYGKN